MIPEKNIRIFSKASGSLDANDYERTMIEHSFLFAEKRDGEDLLKNRLWPDLDSSADNEFRSFVKTHFFSCQPEPTFTTPNVF